MALSAATVWEVRASGTGVSDNDGGGYAPLTVSTFSGTNLVVDGSNNLVVTSATHNFVAADVNGRIQITNAPPSSWTPGFYTIVSVASNAATLNASPAPVGTTSGAWLLTGQDRSQQNSPQVAIDNSVITTSITANVITFTGYTPTVADVGNVVQMLTGTNVTAGFYQITAFTSTTWTVTGAVNLPTSGTTTNATGNMGGALLTLAKLAGAMIASNKAYVVGAFTSTATITFAQSAGPTGAVPATKIIGYSATRGDTGHATLTLSTNTGLTGINGTGNGLWVEQVDVDCGSLGTSTGLSSSTNFTALRCKVSNFTTAGITSTGSNFNAIACEVTGGVAGATAGILQANAGISAQRCFVHDNACTGIRFAAGSCVAHNLVANNSGATSDGIQLTGAQSVVINNTCHNNGRDGIRNSTTASSGLSLRGNLLTNNAGYGITLNSATAVEAQSTFDGNAYYLNTTGTRNLADSTVGNYGISPYANTRDVILTASPYVGPTTGTSANFNLNNTAGGGAACRHTGDPLSWSGNTGSAGFPDMGAVQHQDQSAAAPRVMVVAGQNLPLY